MKAVLDSGEVESFRSTVAQRLGLHFENDKFGFLGEVLRRRMESTGCDSYSLYGERIGRSPGGRREVSALAEELTVGETYFFRYADHFRAFAEVVVPDRLRARGAGRPLRILSAGCASGEEAYSLAILLREHLPELTPSDVTIQGIDINAQMLGKALRARYPAWSLRETPADLREKYFRADGRDFLLDPSMRAAVAFDERNLVEDDRLFWQPGAFDVVFCRNVIMYFAPEALRAVIARIAESLVPGGFLFLGHAETLRGVSQDFHLRHTHETFYYQRRGANEACATVAFPFISSRTDTSTGLLTPAVQPGDTWFDVIQQASERVASLTGGGNGAIPDAAGRTAPCTADPRATPQRPSRDRTLAIELLREERFAEAVGLLRSLPPESKTDTDTQLLLAVLLTNSGDLPEAEKVCWDVLKLDELNAGAHYLMALCREHMGDAAAAAEHDRAAMYLDPAFAMPHLHLGLVAKRSADWETAKRELGRALPLLDVEDTSRILLFGGGFSREALADFCRAELRACGGAA